MTKTLEILTKYLEHEYAGMYIPVKPLDEIAREIDEARRKETMDEVWSALANLFTALNEQSLKPEKP